MRTSTRRLTALLGAVTTAALLAVPAVAAPSPDRSEPVGTSPMGAGLQAAIRVDTSRTQLLPGTGKATSVRIADDAVYVVAAGQPSTLWRRPLTVGPAGTSVGAATAIADLDVIDGVWPVGFAEHDGALAYARASDGRLVLRDAAGAETVPAWAQAGRFNQVFTGLTADWLTTTEISGGNPQVWNVHTGVQVPLKDLAPVPAEYTSAYVESVAVSSNRVVWTMHAWNGTADLCGVFTVALDPADADGAVGAVATVATTTLPHTVANTFSYLATGIVGEAVVWVRQDRTSSVQNTVQWYPGAPYTGTPVQVSAASDSPKLDGTVLAVPRGSGVEWYDVARSVATPLRSVELPGFAFTMAATDRLLSYGDMAGTAWLTDATGGVVSDKPLPTDLRPSDAFFADIIWLVAQGITGGYADGSFRPQGSVTRAAMAAFLYRLGHGGADAPGCTAAAFTDVPAADPFCGEIAWLASTGITTGYADGTFRPGQAVTREAMAAFIYRYANAGNRAPACTSAPFVDVAVSHPFCGEISWMATRGISTGWSDHTFRPGLTIARQAMAAFLHRYTASSVG